MRLVNCLLLLLLLLWNVVLLLLMHGKYIRGSASRLWRPHRRHPLRLLNNRPVGIGYGWPQLLLLLWKLLTVELGLLLLLLMLILDDRLVCNDDILIMLLLLLLLEDLLLMLLLL